MSLYVFNVKPTSAIVTADTRQSIAKGGQLYRLNDITRKLHIVDDTIVTVGGVAWIGLMEVSRWSSSADHSIGGLHTIVMNMLPRLDEYAAALRAPAVDHTNPYLLELCALRFEPSLGYNVFYHIATYSGYRLERFEMDETVYPEAMMYGGIDYEIVQEYFKVHPSQVKTDYIIVVHAAYEQAAGEKIGGTLLIAEQNKSKVSLKERMIQDRGPVRSHSLTDGTVYNMVGKGLSRLPGCERRVHAV